MSQADKLLALLSDEKPHRTDEILRVVYGNEHLGLARPPARVDDLKKRGHSIRGWHDTKQRTLYWYQLIPPSKPDWLKYHATEKQPELAKLF